jgi:signal transduction histidine kinase
VARHLMNEQPSLLEPALGAIEDETRKALDDLRRLLGLLRETPDEEVRAGTAPTPGLAELATLIELHRQSYGPVTVDIEPGAQHLDDSACLTVFRIVQEALTNARKHAPMCEVRIRVAARAGDVIVTVENAASGRPAAGRGEGFGLLGMRERVGLFGGVFEAGPTTTGGFSVRAVLPGVAGVGLST